MVLQALAAAQARHTLFIPGQPVVVAVSGGADSVCLLYALHQHASCWQLALHVAHLDHALRPESSDDAAFVAAFAQQLQLPFYSMRLSPGSLDDDPRGLEAAARSARYAFLRHVALQIDTPVTIATAHHQDDQAETLLLHLVQGSGLNGLAAMAWVAHLPDEEQPPIRLVRPLLGVSRASIHDYLRSKGLQWREDASNQETTHLRNRLRHEVLPVLADINPNIHATLARTPIFWLRKLTMRPNVIVRPWMP
jgi:tRNA(Ile)-lysidine synthase